jgi:hypothetical protein
MTGTRVAILVLALVGFAVALYLSLYQWHVIDPVFEPFFGDGSTRILRQSSIAKLSQKYLRVPDAFLGALAYLAEAVGATIGGVERWRTMPRTVLAFGCLVMLMAFASILLIVAQPLLFDAWCTLCLCSAGLSIAIAVLAMNEFLASARQLRHGRNVASASAAA